LSNPVSWNVYDSYGEALLKNGQKEEAIKAYQKSVAMIMPYLMGVHLLRKSE
jgi:hypothetical protein